MSSRMRALVDVTAGARPRITTGQPTSRHEVLLLDKGATTGRDRAAQQAAAPTGLSADQGTPRTSPECADGRAGECIAANPKPLPA